MGHEVVDGVAGFRFLPALVQRTTECFHHSHLPKGRKTRERPQQREEKVRHKKRDKETRETQRQTDLCPPADKHCDRQTDRQRLRTRWLHSKFIPRLVFRFIFYKNIFDSEALWRLKIILLAGLNHNGRGQISTVFWSSGQRNILTFGNMLLCFFLPRVD